MGNRRKLTEVEEFYVKHNPEDLTIEEMAIKMSCNKNILVDMLNADKVVVPTPEAVPEKEVVPPTTKKYEATRFMKTIGKGSAGGRKGVVVNTPAASEIADEFKEQTRHAKGKYHSAIHNPCGEDYDGK